MKGEIKIVENTLLSDNWYRLNKVSYATLTNEGQSEIRIREVYDRGNGATILLYNKTQNTIILTRQFRLPTFLNGNPNGMLIETCAGIIDDENPIDCIRRETEEETGYRIKDVRKIFDAYMSPGAVTEKLHFFVAEYDRSMKVSEGGGLAEEQEEIEVLEMQFDEAFEMIGNGTIKDAKTIMLLQYAKINGLFPEE